MPEASAADPGTFDLAIPKVPALPVVPDTAEGLEKLTDAQLFVLAGGEVG